MRSFAALISSMLALTSTTHALPHSLLQTRQDDNAAITAAVPPRLVAYIQTFRSVDGGPLSLLPLLQENTGVTHVLLSAVHLNEQPGDINLNDHPPSDTMYDTLWSEAKQLQEGGIKVMMMLGGAARGTFQRLSGDDESVSPTSNNNTNDSLTSKRRRKTNPSTPLVPHLLRPPPDHPPQIQHPRPRHRHRRIRPPLHAPTPPPPTKRRPRP
jgi:hypothetical protein